MKADRHRRIEALRASQANKFEQHRFRSTLNSLLSIADPEQFIRMVWAVDALQSGRVQFARSYLEFPPEAITSDITSRYYVHKWYLETLINEFLTTEQILRSLVHANKRLNCQSFAAVPPLRNALAGLENSEDVVVLQKMAVLIEMSRIGHKQFEWQRGFVNLQALYRAAYIFSGDVTLDIFLERHGLTIADAMRFGFGLYALLRSQPKISTNTDMSAIGIDASVRKAAMELVAAPLAEARRQAVELRRRMRFVAYKPSVLRRTPCIIFKGQTEVLYCPLPDLLILRITDGLYYDVVGNSAVANEIGAKFEAYTFDFCVSMLRSLEPTKSFSYKLGGQKVESPDILLLDNHKIKIVIECKAKRMTFDARFAEDPVGAASSGFAEIAKGVFQVWRFLSHSRRGLIESHDVDADAIGVVLTLDKWLVASREQKLQVLSMAKAMANTRDPEISDLDCKPVVFCPVDDLEDVLYESSDEDFVRVLKASLEERYNGWSLPSVFRDIAKDRQERKQFPFRDQLQRVLPWWPGFAEGV